MEVAGDLALNMLTQAYAEILSLTVEESEGTLETPRRAAKAWLEFVSGYDTDIAGLFTTFEADGYDQMIAVTGLPFTSLCEHHMLPFTGFAHVGYIPSERVVGLSKVPRLVQAYAHRLQIQERLTSQVADALQEHLDPIGVGVVIDATHTCMTLRGVRSDGMMRTSALYGAIRDNPETRAEFFSLIRR